jgi:hypothetical protein
MLWTVLILLLILWILGLLTNVGGALIHALLVVVLVIFVINLLAARRSAV